jgi:hypothetical protein
VLIFSIWPFFYTIYRFVLVKIGKNPQDHAMPENFGKKENSVRKKQFFYLPWCFFN